MSLTHAPGPLAGEPGPTNYAIEGPKHRLLATPLPRRIRAELRGEVVIDTEGALLLHETGLKPALYVPLADVRADALTRTDHTTHCPFKGDASYRTVAGSENAVWVYDAPLAPAAWLEGYAGAYLERFDRWLDEDEEVQGFPDPYHRVDVRPIGGRATVTAGEGDGAAPIADSTRALVLSETAVPNRYYLPREDVTATLHGPTATTSWCPYKGTATYWTVELEDGTRLEDAAWSYEDPFPESERVRGLVSFWGDAHTTFIRS